jgi:hypothetical protein
VCRPPDIRDVGWYRRDRGHAKKGLATPDTALLGKMQLCGVASGSERDGCHMTADSLRRGVCRTDQNVTETNIGKVELQSW